MQSNLKKEITNWERLGKRYHKDAMKIFRNIKNQLEKKAPNREDLNKFGKIQSSLNSSLIRHSEIFLTILESKINASLTKLDSILVAFEEQLAEVSVTNFFPP